MRALALLVALAGCESTPPRPAPSNIQPAHTGSIRVKVKRREGGAIALFGDHAAAMTQATREMEQNCGAGAFKVMEEGDEPLDVESTESAWTVHYVCLGI